MRRRMKLEKTCDRRWCLCAVSPEAPRDKVKFPIIPPSQSQLSQCPSWHLLVRKVDNGDNSEGPWLLSVTQEAPTMRWDFHESRLNSANIKQLWGFHIHDWQVNWDNNSKLCHRGLVIQPRESKRDFNVWGKTVAVSSTRFWIPTLRRKIIKI